MTYSNGMFNPLPCANPFNTRLGPSNYTLNPLNSMAQYFTINRSSKQLPDPTPARMSTAADLHPPCTEPPMSLGRMLMTIDEMYSVDKTWNDREIMTFDLHGNSTAGMSNRDIQYWKNAEEQSKKLEANMSPEQKKALEDALNMFPESKFEDE